MRRYLLADHDIMMTSIEPDPSHQIWGSSHLHIIDTIQNLMLHVQPASFDVAILNGIIGWGLDTNAGVADAAVALHASLRPGGLLVIGYNVGYGTCCHQFQSLFAPTELGGLPQKIDLINSPFHHVYEFHKKIG